VNHITLIAKPLTADAFAPFGEVIESANHAWRWINDNTCRRYDELARVDVLEAGGLPGISLFEADPRPLPLRLGKLERHPLSSQAFYPLQARAFLVVVAEDGVAPIATRIRAFLASGNQGVNYRRNTWHHALIAIEQTSRFLVVDRSGNDENCEEIVLDGAVQVNRP
jgi:ureidoglycolate lyase